MIMNNKLFSNIFKCFVSMFSDLMVDMSHTKHSMSINHINPYHMEGDVWTHTCCSYTYLQTLSNECDLSLNDYITLALSILLHDSGKPYSVQLSKKHRRCFFKHEQFSVRFIIKNIFRLREFIGDIVEQPLIDNIIIDIMLLVNAHNIFYNLNDRREKIFGYLNYNERLYKLFKYLIHADNFGQIVDVDNITKNSKLDFPKWDNTIKPDVNNNINKSKIITLMCGIPASGKDTIIRNTFDYDFDVFSFDNIRVREYLKYNPDKKQINNNELYHNAFKWCNKHKINLFNLIIDDIINSNKKYIVISNTNLTRKVRKKLINLIRNKIDCEIRCHCIITPPDVAIKRDKSRASFDKKVGDSVINDMFNIFTLPTMNENFNSIEYIINV